MQRHRRRVAADRPDDLAELAVDVQGGGAVGRAELDAPFVERTYESPFRSTDHNLYVDGRFVYQANYSIGLRILEMDDAGNKVRTCRKCGAAFAKIAAA